ncbi:36421_t:CDS:2 [Gigaspora margarita]|uniref:36421_t:CDS:1 n=1 Tax=Gigaspora margarita TaxID=4874 RepID=A0ABN7UMV7_GIGMA|nr:36421_t:CDS:2 [Gigaspora margarita]
MQKLISQAKMIETIKAAQLYKATGQMMISNEMLKKLPTKRYEIKVLSSTNNVALPNISTAQPIQQISHIQEDAHMSKKNL